MNKKGKKYILLDVIIVILLAAVIISFILPSRKIKQDMRAVTKVETSLSALQAGIDIYYTRMNEKMPGEPGKGIEAVNSIIKDLSEEEILDILNINEEELKSAFAQDIEQTEYKRYSDQNYEITVFARDRAPHKFIMDYEEIKSIDPEKRLVEILGELEGLKKDIKNKIKKFKLIESNSAKIDDYFKKIDQIINEMEDNDYLTMLEENVENADKLEDVNKNLYNDTRKKINQIGTLIAKTENIKKSSAETVRNIGGISVDAEKFQTEINDILGYVEEGKLISRAKDLNKEAAEIKEEAESVHEKLYPQSQELAKKVENRQEELDKVSKLHLEYKNRFQQINSKYAEMKEEE